MPNCSTARVCSNRSPLSRPDIPWQSDRPSHSSCQVTVYLHATLLDHVPMGCRAPAGAR